MDIDKFLSWIPLKRFKNPAPRVGVLRLQGIIASSGRNALNLNRLDAHIEEVFSIPRVKAVALTINSPGGSPVQSSLIAARIRKLSEEKGVPVIAFVEDVAASGGYWLAVAADEIYADRSSIVGSVGVIFSGFGFEEALDKLGVERRLYTAGKQKSLLDPFKGEKPEDVVRLREIQDEIHVAFKEHVRARRGDRLKGEDEDLFEGQIWTGAKARDLGIIDGLTHLHEEMRRRFGERVKMKLVNPPKRGPLSFLKSSDAGLGDGEGFASGLMQAVEERSFWSRWGL